MKNLIQNVVIETERLYLKRVDEKDFTDLINIHSNQDVMKYIENGKYNWTYDEFKKEIEPHTKDYSKGYGFWTAIEKESEKVCGKCGIIENVKKEGNVELEIGYLFGQEFWGNGYATEISQAIVKYAFQNLGVDELFAYTFKDNKRSIKVVQKIGMNKLFDFKVKGYDIVKFSVKKCDLKKH